MHLASLLSRHARYRPDHLAVVCDDQRLTYRAFNDRVNRCANALLGLGLEKGDKVAALLPNCLELLELYWAAAKTGLVMVPLSPLLRGAGLARLLNDSDSVALVTTQALLPYLESVRSDLSHLPAERCLVIDWPSSTIESSARSYERLTAAASPAEPPEVVIHGDDPYNIIYSSGTTGLPKGIVHTHAIRAGYAALFAAAYRMRPESVVLHVGSIVFNGAFLTLLPAFFLGATYILHRQFDPMATIETIARERVTHIKMVPSQIIALLNAPNWQLEKLDSLEMLGSVGAPLHLEYKQAVHRALPGRFYELYGLTEGFMTILDKMDYPAKPGSVGTPIPFYEMRIVDEEGRERPAGQVGEIIGRGPLMMPGYYKRPDLTAQAIRDGWLYSGDLGYVDEDGFLYLVDRQKDLIISGGVNIYPRDIEEIVVQHPLVREAAVLGMPDEKWGETPVAAVILHRPGTISATDLQEWVNARVEARFQKIAAVILMEDFPRSVAGKTLKRVMRQDLMAKW